MPRSSAAKAETQPGSHSRPAPESAQHEEETSAKQPPSSVNPVEPEDAHVTGTSRSLQRRVLGLNVEGKQAHGHPENPPAQHATGSFTGSETRRKAS